MNHFRISCMCVCLISVLMSILSILNQVASRCWHEWCNSISLVTHFTKVSLSTCHIPLGPIRSFQLHCSSISSYIRLTYYVACWLSRGIINDSYKMDLILIHPPHLIALACIFISSVIKDKENPSWFEELRADMNVVSYNATLTTYHCSTIL